MFVRPRQEQVFLVPSGTRRTQYHYLCMRKDVSENHRTTEACQLIKSDRLGSDIKKESDLELIVNL